MVKWVYSEGSKYRIGIIGNYKIHQKITKNKVWIIVNREFIPIEKRNKEESRILGKRNL